jgi:hypothetical protein
MNIDANKFFPSNETGTRSTTIVEEDLLLRMLQTDFQREIAQSVLHEWDTATTLSSDSRMVGQA